MLKFEELLVQVSECMHLIKCALKSGQRNTKGKEMDYLMKVVSFFFSPFVFGIGFLAPLIAQIIDLWGVPTGDVNSLIVGLILGGVLGLMAQLRGSWLWIKP